MRITVFCSAIVIDVIVHSHTAGAVLSQTAENNCPYHRVVGFLILSGQFIITLVAELGIQPLIRSFWTETSAITFSTFSIAVTVFPSSTYGGDLSLSVDGACIIAFSAQCTKDYEESRQGMTVFAGDAASFHEWQFRLASY